MTKEKLIEILEIAYRRGRDNGERRTEKNFNDLLNIKAVKIALNGQRELLIDCVEHCNYIDNYEFRTTEDKVDNYLKTKRKWF